MRKDSSALFVKPWNDEVEKIFQMIAHFGRAESTNTKLSWEFGKKCPQLRDMGFMDWGVTNYSKKEDKALFQIKHDVIVQLKPGLNGINFHFKRFKIL